MNNSKFKVKLIIIGSLGLFLLILIIFIYYLNSRQSVEESVYLPLEQNPTRPIFKQPTTTASFPTKIPAVEEIDPFSHGAPPDVKEQYLQENPEQLALEKLRDQTPIKTEQFRIEYSFADVKFIVFLNSSQPKARSAFIDFLAKQGIVNSLDQFMIYAE